MDKKIYYCDFLHNKEGHFDNDFKVINGYEPRLKHIKESMKQYRNPIKKILLLKKYLYKSKNINIIGTVSLLYLFAYSILYKSFDYRLIIHFIPAKRVLLYRVILSILINKCTLTAVYDDSVRVDVLRRCYIKDQKKIMVLHSRIICPMIKKERGNGNLKILMIGGPNIGIKDMDAVISALNKRNYDRLDFIFRCKDITTIDFVNINNNNIKMYDGYVEQTLYESEMQSADFILLPYKKKYGVRCSAILLESLSAGVPVITSSLLCFKMTINKYKCGIIYSNSDELANIFLKIQDRTLSIEISENLYSDYSYENNKRLFLDFVNSAFSNVS